MYGPLPPRPARQEGGGSRHGDLRDALPLAESPKTNGVVLPIVPVGRTAKSGLRCLSRQTAAPIIVLVLLLSLGSSWVQAAPSVHSPATPQTAAPADTQSSPDYLPSAGPLAWTEILPEGVLPSNFTYSPELAYDPQTQQTLLFGGNVENELTSVWSFGAGVWTNVTPSGNLTEQGLAEVSATFDAAAGYLLLFGYVGFNDQTPAVAETWAYSSGTWSQLHPVAEPEGTVMAGVTYDPSSSQVILVTTLYRQSTSLTWAFEANNWTRVVTSASPPALFGSTMTFDNATATRAVVLFADGWNTTSRPGLLWNQTWVYSAGEWTNASVTSGAAPPGGTAALTYDPSDQAVLLETPYGFFANVTPGGTWEYANGTWGRLATASPPPDYGVGGSYFVDDPTDGYPLLVSNMISAYSGKVTTETWKLDHTVIGPPPNPALTVSPRNLTEGATVHISASATGGFGAVGLLIQIDIPGCVETLRQAGSWNCTTNGSGEGIVYLGATDQANRRVFVFAIVLVASPPSPVNYLVDGLIVGGMLAAATAAVVLVIRRVRGGRRPETAASASLSPGRLPP
jgi:hypothetical protein